MPDVHTQTLMTGNRIETVWKERRLEECQVAKKARNQAHRGPGRQAHGGAHRGGRPEDREASAEEGSGSRRLRLPSCHRGQGGRHGLRLHLRST